MKRIVKLTESELKRLVEKVLEEQVKEIKMVRGFRLLPENQNFKSSLIRNGDNLRVHPVGMDKVFVSKVDGESLNRFGFDDKKTFTCFVKRKGDKIVGRCPSGTNYNNPKTLGFSTKVEL